MNTFINNLLTYNNKKYDKETNDKADKNLAEKYIGSSIVLIYDIKNKNIISFIKKEKFINKNNEKAKRKMVITSDIYEQRNKKIDEKKMKNIFIFLYKGY